MAFANELGSDHGNDAYLSKIDSLRATNVGSMISLPQVRTLSTRYYCNHAH